MRNLVKRIDLAAYRHNLARLAQLAETAMLMPVVKADAYGHGVANLLPVLLDAPILAVACIEEALSLRALGVNAPIMLLAGVFSADELPECADKAFIPVLHTMAQLEWLAKYVGRVPIKSWLKIDTGMHRLGFTPQAFTANLSTWLELEKQNKVRWQGVLTHFACADEMQNALNYAQLHQIKALDLPFGWQKSWCNSAAILRDELRGGALMRAGLSSYGVSPFMGQTAQALGLKPVMRLETLVIAVRELAKGESAGYGQHFIAPERGYLATIALGYGDGFSREIVSGRVQVKIADALYPLVGRVAMDMALVWLGNAPVAVGERVLLWGESPLMLEQVAQSVDTIPYTLTTSLSARVRSELINA